jgi:Ca-activated chloride channel family protein
MTFQEPAFLFGAAAGLLAILLGLRALRERRRRLEAFSRLHSRLTNAAGSSRGVAECLLLAFALVLLSVSAGRPVLSTRLEVRAAREGIDLLVVMDTSRSMQAMEDGTTRLDRALRETRALLDDAKGDRLGLLAFAGDARLVCPLTHDLESLRHFLDELDLNAAPGPGSSLGVGLLAAVRLLDGAEGREKAIVLLSDGEDLNPERDPVEAARAAASKGIRVYTMMFGAPEGAKIPLEEEAGFVRDPGGEEVISRPDPRRMARIAEAGSGAFVAAYETAFPLDLLYTQHLGRLAEAAQERESLRRAKPAFQWFALVALLLLLFDCFLPFRRADSRRIPSHLFVAVLLGFMAPAAAGDEREAFVKGVERFQEGRFEDALDAFQRAASEGMQRPELEVNLGLVHLELGDAAAAAPHFERAMASGEEPAVRAARFGAGLAAYARAKALLESVAEAGPPDVERTLEEVLHLGRVARSLFADGLAEGAWPGEAAVNLELSNRLTAAVSKRLGALRAAGRPPAGGEEDGQKGGEGSADSSTGADTGAGGVRTGEGQGARKETGGQGDREAAPDRAAPPRMRLEERREIFAYLEELERKRIALERAMVRAAREQRKGVRDW